MGARGVYMYDCRPLSAAVVAFAVLTACVFFERDGTSDDITAKSHGRAEAISLGIELVLLVFVNTFGTVFNIDFLAVLQIVAGAVWVTSVVFYAPFHNRFMSRLMAGYVSIFTYATTCGLIAKLAEGDASVMFIPGAALAALCGIYLVDLRIQTALVSPVRELTSVYSVDVRARALLARVSAAAAAAAAAATAGRDDIEPEERGGAGGVRGTAGALSEADCAEVTGVFEEARRVFPHSATLSLFAAQFHYTWTRNRHLMTQYLTDGERCGPAFDEQFWVYQVRRLGDEEEVAQAAGAFSAIGRVEFERRVRVAEENAVAVVGVAHSIWTSLESDVVDLAEVQALAVRLNAHVAAAERNFEGALALNPTAAPVLRSYAAFCAALHNTDKMHELQNTAQQVLDAVSKERDKHATDVVFMERSRMDINAGACGVITLGGSWSRGNSRGGVHRLEGGDIRDVNAEACSIFGSSADALCGMDLWELFPFPLSRIFEAAVKDAGNWHLLDVVVAAFGRHATGYCFPMLVKLERTGTVTVRRFRTRDHFVLTVDSVQPFSVVGTRRSDPPNLQLALTSCVAWRRNVARQLAHVRV